jgi:hypothetical protein
VWAGRSWGGEQISGEGETEEGRNPCAKTAPLGSEELHKRQSSRAWQILLAIFSPKDNL